MQLKTEYTSEQWHIHCSQWLDYYFFHSRLLIALNSPQIVVSAAVEMMSIIMQLPLRRGRRIDPLDTNYRGGALLPWVLTSLPSSSQETDRAGSLPTLVKS